MRWGLVRPMGQPPAPTHGLRLKGWACDSKGRPEDTELQTRVWPCRAGCRERGGGERAETCELGTNEGERLQVGGH